MEQMGGEAFGLIQLCGAEITYLNQDLISSGARITGCYHCCLVIINTPDGDNHNFSPTIQTATSTKTLWIHPFSYSETAFHLDVSFPVARSCINC